MAGAGGQHHLIARGGKGLEAETGMAGMWIGTGMMVEGPGAQDNLRGTGAALLAGEGEINQSYNSLPQKP